MLLISSLSFARANGSLTLSDTLYMNAFYERTSQEQADLVRIIESRDPDSLVYVFREYDKDGRLTNSGTTKELYGRPTGIMHPITKMVLKRMRAIWILPERA